MKNLCNGLTLAVLSLFLFPSLVTADELEPLWKRVGDWEIRVDRTLNFGCFMFGAYTRGDVFRIGFDRKDRDGYILVGNEAWRSLEIGKQYPIEFQFDQDPPWHATATAVSLGPPNDVFLYVSFDDPNMMTEMASKLSLTFYYEGRTVTTLPLTGTYAAVQELIDCQRSIEHAKLNDTGPSTSDPFAAGHPASGGDPFSK